MDYHIQFHQRIAAGTGVNIKSSPIYSEGSDTETSTRDHERCTVMAIPLGLQVQIAER